MIGAYRVSCSAVLVWRSPFCVGLFSSHFGCSLRFYPFCSCTLFQRTWLLGLFTRPAHSCLSTFCAPLLRFCSLQCLWSQRRVSPRHFRVWHSPLLRFLVASAVFALCGLSSLFHLVALLGFSFRAFSCKRLVASSFPILSGFEAPSALYRWLLHAHVIVLVVSIRF